MHRMSGPNDSTVSIQDNQLNVIYFYRGKENGSEVTVDHFSFIVIDNNGLFSLPTNVSLSAVTSLLASQGLYSVTEDVPTEIELYGRDYSSTRRDLRVILRSQPKLGGQILNASTTHGEDAIYRTGETIAGIILAASNWTQGVSVRYKSPPNYFTTPNRTVTGLPLQLPYDTFDIQVADSLMVAFSSWETQLVEIRNVNHPTTITRDESLNRNITIQAYSGNAIQESLLVLSNFTVVDPDLDTNFVRVTINAQFGFLSLNASSLAEVDFNSNTYCYFNGRKICDGDGANDKDMTFICSPSVLERAINGMTYYSFRGNVQDTINITIYDGEGGECLDRSLLDPITIFNGCFTTNYQLQVDVTSEAAVSGAQRNSFSQQFVSSNLKYLLLGLMALIIIVVVRWCACCPARRKKYKNHEDHATPSKSPRSGNSGRSMKSPEETRIDDDYDEETGPPAQYPKTISLADITTPTRQLRQPKAVSSLSSSNRVNKKKKSTTNSDIAIESPTTATPTTASTTPTRNVYQISDKAKSTDKKSPSRTKTKLKSQVLGADLITTQTAVNGYVKSQDAKKITGKLETDNGGMNEDTEALWTAHRHSSGRTYYYNRRTKKSVWIKPKEYV